jgi:hypothetical protein
MTAEEHLQTVVIVVAAFTAAIELWIERPWRASKGLDI